MSNYREEQILTSDLPTATSASAGSTTILRESPTRITISRINPHQSKNDQATLYENHRKVTEISIIPITISTVEQEEL